MMVRAPMTLGSWITGVRLHSVTYGGERPSSHVLIGEQRTYKDDLVAPGFGPINLNRNLVLRLPPTAPLARALYRFSVTVEQNDAWTDPVLSRLYALPRHVWAVLPTLEQGRIGRIGLPIWRAGTPTVGSRLPNGKWPVSYEFAVYADHPEFGFQILLNYETSGVIATGAQLIAVVQPQAPSARLVPASTSCSFWETLVALGSGGGRRRHLLHRPEPRPMARRCGGAAPTRRPGTPWPRRGRARVPLRGAGSPVLGRWLGLAGGGGLRDSDRRQLARGAAPMSGAPPPRRPS